MNNLKLKLINKKVNLMIKWTRFVERIQKRLEAPIAESKLFLYSR